MVPDAAITASLRPVAAMPAFRRALYGLVSVKLSGSVDTRLAVVLDPSIVEQHPQPFGGAHPEVVRALGADVQVRRQVLVVDNLRAAGTLDHQPLGNPAGLLGRRARSLAGLLEPRHKGSAYQAEARRLRSLTVRARVRGQDCPPAHSSAARIPGAGPMLRICLIRWSTASSLPSESNCEVSTTSSGVAL